MVVLFTSSANLLQTGFANCQPTDNAVDSESLIESIESLYLPENNKPAPL
jgi:hypothetical protein